MYVLSYGLLTNMWSHAIGLILQYEAINFYISRYTYLDFSMNEYIACNTSVYGSDVLEKNVILYVNATISVLGRAIADVNN